MEDQVYRSRPTKKRPKGERWRLLSKHPECSSNKDWEMVRVRDGHRLFLNPKNLTLEIS